MQLVRDGLEPLLELDLADLRLGLCAQPPVGVGVAVVEDGVEVLAEGSRRFVPDDAGLEVSVGFREGGCRRCTRARGKRCWRAGHGRGGRRRRCDSSWGVVTPLFAKLTGGDDEQHACDDRRDEPHGVTVTTSTRVHNGAVAVVERPFVLQCEPAPMASPAAALCWGGTAALAVLVGAPMPLSLGLGALVWSGLVLRKWRIAPRWSRPAPWRLAEPWRRFVVEHVDAERRFRGVVSAAEPGPLQNALTAMQPRVVAAAQRDLGCGLAGRSAR